MEVQRLLGVGWQPEAVKNGIFANGEATQPVDPLGVSLGSAT